MNPLNNNFNGGLSPELMQSINQMKTIMNMASGNPNQMVEQLAKQSPQFSKILQLCNTKNQTPEQLFYAMCSERGIDPQAVLDQLRR